jgi:hypothetical protein
MIVEGLFVYLPTIIAITIAFFVGVATGILVLGVCGVACGYAVFKIPQVKSFILSWLEED